jgi:hypothetical protein
LRELCGALLDDVRLHMDGKPLMTDCALFLHRQYTRNKALVGLRLPESVGQRHTQAGQVCFGPMNTGVFFATLDESEKKFSPTTRYEDFAVSATRFHWQSQSTTSKGPETGQRYVRQKENGAQFLLFVRPKRRDAFVFLGPLRYVSQSGSRPMITYWDLDYAMPAWFFEICAALRAA